MQTNVTKLCNFSLVLLVKFYVTMATNFGRQIFQDLEFFPFLNFLAVTFTILGRIVFGRFWLFSDLLEKQKSHLELFLLLLVVFFEFGKMIYM